MSQFTKTLLLTPKPIDKPKENSLDKFIAIVSVVIILSLMCLGGQAMMDLQQIDMAKVVSGR